MNNINNIDSIINEKNYPRQHGSSRMSNQTPNLRSSQLSNHSYQDQIKNIYNTIDNNDVAVKSELNQIQLEEFYLNKLRDQREKMEYLRTEFGKKDKIILQYQEEIIYLKEILQDSESLKLQFDSMQQIINRLEDINRRDEQEIIRLRDENQQYQRSYSNKDKCINDLKEENLLIQNVQSEMEETEKEYTYNEQIKSLKLENERLQQELDLKRVDTDFGRSRTLTYEELSRSLIDLKKHNSDLVSELTKEQEQQLHFKNRISKMKNLQLS